MSSPLNWQDLQNALADSKAIFGDKLDMLLDAGNWMQVAELEPDAALVTDLSHLGFFPSMRRWVGDKQIKQMEAYTYRVESQKHESSVAVDKFKMREAARNRGDRSLANALGLPAILSREAKAAAAIYDSLVFSALANGHQSTHPTYGEDITCFDGQPFFDTAHPNGSQGTYSNEDETAAADAWFLCDSRVLPVMVLEHMRPEIVNQMDPEASDKVWETGMWRLGIEAHIGTAYTLPQACFRSTAAVSTTNIDAHLVTAAGYVNDQGEPLDVNLDTIIYGPSNAAAIEDIVVQSLVGSGDTNNRFFNRFKLVKSNRL